ncbi:MAG: MMPL family transporter [Pirellulales bacterium]|nr:MMPL family transporter [Pirellulales bacterium]
MYFRLGSFIARHWKVVILFWIVLAAGLKLWAPRWDDVTHDGDLAYLPPRMTSVRGEALLAQAFPDTKVRSQAVLVVERPDGELTPADYYIADKLASKFEKLIEEAAEEQTPLPIAAVWSHNTEVLGSKLTSPVSDRGQATLVILSLTNEFMATDNIRLLDEFQIALDDVRQDPHFPAGLNLGISGSAAIGGDMLGSAKESIESTEITAIVLVFLILLFVYRAPLLVIIPLTAIVLSVSVATDVVAWLADYSAHSDWLHFKIFKTTKIFVVVILYGSGTDFSLFLISRYREELEHGYEKSQAIERALGSVGEALVGSALTTILGLSMMYFADFGKFRYSGPVIGLCLLITLIACLTFAPAMLRACGTAVFWPFGFAPARQQNRQGLHLSGLLDRFWNWASHFIIRWPGVILAASILLMLYPAWRGLSVDITYNLLNELQQDRPSVVGTNLVRRHFPAGDVGPVTVVAYNQQGKFDTREGEIHIAELTKQLWDVPGVVAVRSLSEPLGDKPGYANIFSRRGQRKVAAKKHNRTLSTFLTQVPELQGQITRFDLIFEKDPFSPEAEELLNVVDAKLQNLSQTAGSPWFGTEFDFTGTTAGKRDLKAVTTSDQWVIQQLVTIAVLGVLLLILRRPLICLYLIVSVIVSYLVTIGITEAVFATLYSGTYEGLDWKVPIFLFVILVAIGEDYNIYLVTRVLEEQAEHGPLEGLRLAVVKTGGIISSCGLIMAGSFISMMTGSLRGMLELGFALSLGILLDTFFVRPVIVPAFLAIVARREERRRPSEHGRRSHGDSPIGLPLEAPGELAERAGR